MRLKQNASIGPETKKIPKALHNLVLKPYKSTYLHNGGRVFFFLVTLDPLHSPC